MAERYDTKTIGRYEVTAQFFGSSFGHATLVEALAKERGGEPVRFDEEGLHDAIYALTRIVAQIEEAKRRG